MTDKIKAEREAIEAAEPEAQVAIVTQLAIATVESSALVDPAVLTMARMSQMIGIVLRCARTLQRLNERDREAQDYSQRIGRRTMLKECLIDAANELGLDCIEFEVNPDRSPVSILMPNGDKLEVGR